jgi:hypothetical protein
MSAYSSQGDRGENWAAFAGIVFVILGIALAALNAVLALLSVGAYPFGRSSSSRSTGW